ncbi:uncharacterized protein LOC118436757 [Folsomia candida]|uniref:uncharacterized protein LOC118436757 n=1 Tax=Folsomia candida TaxID=158441 RepID=UPI00160546EE|nr:uncharacterized protein LOC118436757 [Folsomia candida]
MSHHHEEKSYTNSFNFSKSETYKSVVTTGPPGACNVTSAPLIKQETWNSSPSAVPVVVAQPEIAKENKGVESAQTFSDTVCVTSTTGISTSMSTPIITFFFIALLIIMGLLTVLILSLTGVFNPEPKSTLAPHSGTEPFTTTIPLPLTNSTTSTVPRVISSPPHEENPTVNITCLHDLHSIGSTTTVVTITSLYSKQDNWDWSNATNLGIPGPKINLQILSKSLEDVVNLNKILDYLRNRVENVTLNGRDLMTCPDSRNKLLSPIILPEVIKLEIFNLTRCLINNVLKYWQVPKVLDIFVYCTDKKEEYGRNLMRLFDPDPEVKKLKNFHVNPKNCHEIHI